MRNAASRQFTIYRKTCLTSLKISVSGIIYSVNSREFHIRRFSVTTSLLSRFLFLVGDSGAWSVSQKIMLTHPKVTERSVSCLVHIHVYWGEWNKNLNYSLWQLSLLEHLIGLRNTCVSKAHFWVCYGRVILRAASDHWALFLFQLSWSREFQHHIL